MARVSKLIDEELLKKAQNKLEHSGYKVKGVIKLKAIIAAKEHGISKVAEIFNVTRNTIISWINKLKNNEEIFNIKKGRGRKSRLNEMQMSAVKSWLIDKPNLTIKQIELRIMNEFAIVLKHSAIHKILKKFNLSYITPRPKHYKQDSTKHEEFKKKDSRKK